MAEMKRSAPFLPMTDCGRSVMGRPEPRVRQRPRPARCHTRSRPEQQVYPRGIGFCAHVLGYVGPVSDYDLERLEDPINCCASPGFRSAKSVIEAKQPKTCCAAKAGTKRVEVNATGRVMRELDRREGHSRCKDLQLTIDSKLQSYVQARLTDESASAGGDGLSQPVICWRFHRRPPMIPICSCAAFPRATTDALTENKYRPLASTRRCRAPIPPDQRSK